MAVYVEFTYGEHENKSQQRGYFSDSVAIEQMKKGFISHRVSNSCREAIYNQHFSFGLLYYYIRHSIFNRKYFENKFNWPTNITHTIGVTHKKYTETTQMKILNNLYKVGLISLEDIYKFGPHPQGVQVFSGNHLVTPPWISLFQFLIRDRPRILTKDTNPTNQDLINAIFNSNQSMYAKIGMAFYSFITARKFGSVGPLASMGRWTKYGNGNGVGSWGWWYITQDISMWKKFYVQNKSYVDNYMRTTASSNGVRILVRELDYSKISADNYKQERNLIPKHYCFHNQGVKNEAKKEPKKEPVTAF